MLRSSIWSRMFEAMWTKKEVASKIHEFAKEFVANTDTAYKQREINEWIESNLK